jgi:RimJ/RimL family protein N-acetyltransferase
MDPLTERAPRNLVTARLRLRSWRDEDEGPMLAMSTDPEVMHHFPRAMTAEEVHAFVVRHRSLLEAGEPGLYALERLDDSSFIGFVGLATPTFEAPFTPGVEVGWRLVRAAWGHGYATEAARAALRQGFEGLGLDEVVSFTSVGNERSISVMRRLGMHRVMEFDHPRLPEGHALRRHVLYRLRADEWRKGGSDG